MKIIFLILAIALSLTVLVEIGLRLVLGLGNPLLYQADEEIGYLLAGQQKVQRLGKRIEINQYSMRSAPIDSKRPENRQRILLLGDSIANGAWWTDQSETISALLEKQLTNSNPVEVLNASANSWGPRNQLAYLNKYSSFESQIIILLMNTDDLFSAPPNPYIVGRDPNYPATRPPLALVELWQRYFPSKSQPIPTPPKDQGDIVTINLQAVAAIHRYSQEQQAQLIIALTPLLREVENEQRPYESKARQRLEEFARQENIPYFDLLPRLKAQSSPKTLYRDTIHLTATGNEIVSQTLAEAIKISSSSRLNTP